MYFVVHAQEQSPTPELTVGLLLLLLAPALAAIGYLLWQQRRARAMMLARLDELARLSALGRFQTPRDPHKPPPSLFPSPTVKRIL